MFAGMFAPAESGEAVPRLLAALDKLVGADPSPPGFRGVICVGVRAKSDTHWWVAEFDGTVFAYFSARMPLGFDVAVSLSEESVHAVAEGATPLEGGWVTGDQRVLEKFVSRYLSTQNWLSIRQAPLPSRSTR